MIETDLTTDDVATALQLNKATVQRLLKTGRLEGYQIGRTWRVRPSALEALRKQSEPLARASSENIVPISVIDDYERWAKAVLSEEHLADVPPIPLEAMRREAIYEGRD